VLPPVASTAYEEVAPTTNLSLRSGVDAVPSHKVHPPGIDAEDPDHKVIIPAGNAVEVVSTDVKALSALFLTLRSPEPLVSNQSCPELVGLGADVPV
tara:strand:- start:180 stop:470 length:291 start_codon:yes stop_codon:yes gene_type:complete